MTIRGSYLARVHWTWGASSLLAFALFSACDATDKAGGDASKQPPPSPSPTVWSWSSQTSNTSTPTTSSGTPNSGVDTVADPVVTTPPDDPIPGDVSGTGSNTTSGTTAGAGISGSIGGSTSPTTGTSTDPDASSWTGGNGTTPSTDSTSTVGTTSGNVGGAQVPAPCRTMIVFNTSGNGISFRNAPSSQADPVEVLPEGTRVEATGIVGGVWVAGKANGKSGFAAGNFLTCDAAAAAQGAGGANPEGEAASAGKAVVPEKSDCKGQ